MGDALKKVQAGQPLRIPAATFNTFIDVARDHQQRQNNAETRHQASSLQSGVVPVRNEAVAAVARYGVLAIKRPVIPPDVSLDGFKNHRALIGYEPVAGTHEGKFVITAEPIAVNSIGAAFASGVCPVQINVLDSTHDYADIADGDTAKLVSQADPGGARILWKEVGTGTLWAIIRFGEQAGSLSVRRARAQENAPADHRLSVKLLDGSGSETGSAFDVQEINGRNFDTLNPLVATGDDLLIAKADDTWYALNFTPSQAGTGGVVRVTITGNGDDGNSYIAAQLDDSTAITLHNVNGRPWYDLLPNLKGGTAGRNKCFAIQIGGTYYAIPDFADIGRVT